MKLFKQLVLSSLIGVASVASAQNVKIVGLVELTGTGTTSGTNFDNGIKLAVKEINAAGGILGKKVDYVSYDTQSNPGVAKGLTDKAVDEGAYVVMGPVFSGSIMVSMASTKRAEIPNFTGGEAAARDPGAVGAAHWRCGRGAGECAHRQCHAQGSGG